MSVYSVYIISESGSLVYHYDHNIPKIEVQELFNYPLPFMFEEFDSTIVVKFGSTDIIKPGYQVLSVNGVKAKGTNLEDGRNIMELFKDPKNYPVSLQVGKAKLRPNDRITLAGMFQPLYSMARVLTPKDVILKDSQPSGIQTISTPSCNIHCYQSYPGVKFLLITDSKTPVSARENLKKVYELYTDYVLKNPFRFNNQPFNFEFFSTNIKSLCEQIER